MVKSLPAVWETRVRSLGQEDPLEKGLATQSSILALKIPCTEEPGKLQSMGSQRVKYDWPITQKWPISSTFLCVCHLYIFCEAVSLQILCLFFLCQSGCLFLLNCEDSYTHTYIYTHAHTHTHTHTNPLSDIWFVNISSHCVSLGLVSQLSEKTIKFFLFSSYTYFCFLITYL